MRYVLLFVCLCRRVYRREVKLGRGEDGKSYDRNKDFVYKGFVCSSTLEFQSFILIINSHVKIKAKILAQNPFCL